MKDRIQIDGVWYVRETEPQPEFLDVKIHTSLSAHYENDPNVIKLLEEMNENGIKHFRSFLNELNKLGWF